MTKEKADKGLLFQDGDGFDDADWGGGDPETIFSIATFWCDDPDADDTWEADMLAALEELFKTN